MYLTRWRGLRDADDDVAREMIMVPRGYLSGVLSSENAE
jgi:hypothetical protein